MSKCHLFSNSLFNTLFRHNLIAPDGYVKATDQQLLTFREFLVQQAKDKTTELYLTRKKLVDEVSDLLKEDELPSNETERLLLLLHRLNLKISAEGLLEDDKLPSRQYIYLGTSEPNQSKYERQMLAEENRLKVLRRDLKKLDDWLDDINKPDRYIQKPAAKSPTNSKKDEFRFRKRTERRNQNMEKARKRLISAYHAETTKGLKRTLSKKDNPGRVRFKKDVGSSTNTEDEFALKIRKSVATERIDVHPGVVRDIDEDTKLRPNKGVTTYASEPIMGTEKDPCLKTLKDRKYGSDSSLDDKANGISPTIDEAKQRIIAWEDGGIDTQFSVEDEASGSKEKVKTDSKKNNQNLDYNKVPSDNKHKTILKASRKRIDKAYSTDMKNIGNITPRDSKQGIKNRTVDNKDRIKKELSKQQSAEGSKDRKSSNTSTLLRKKVTPITQREGKVKPADQDKDGSKVEIDNLQKIIDPNHNNKGKGRLLKTKDFVDKNKRLSDPQVKKRSITSQNKMDNRPLSKSLSKKDGSSLERQLNLKRDFKSEQLSNISTVDRRLQQNNVKPPGKDKADNKSKKQIQQKAHGSKSNIKELGKILKTTDSVSKNKNLNHQRATNMSNLSRGKVVTKILPRSLDKEDGLSLESQSDPQNEFKNTQGSSTDEEGLVERSNKTTKNNQEIIIASQGSRNKNDVGHNVKKQSRLQELIKKLMKMIKKKKPATSEEQPTVKYDVAGNENGGPSGITTEAGPGEKSKKKDFFAKDKDKTIKGIGEKNFNSEENIAHLVTSKSEDELSFKNQSKLKEGIAKNKNEDELSHNVIKSHPKIKSKERNVLTGDKNLSLEQDFLHSQSERPVRKNSMSKSEEKSNFNTGFVKNIKGIDEKDGKGEFPILVEQLTSDSKDSNPPTLEQQLSRETINNCRKSKAKKNNESNINRLKGGTKNVKKLPVEKSDCLENLAHQKYPMESKSNNETERVKNEDRSLDQKHSLKSEIHPWGKKICSPNNVRPNSYPTVPTLEQQLSSESINNSRKNKETKINESNINRLKGGAKSVKIFPEEKSDCLENSSHQKYPLEPQSNNETESIKDEDISPDQQLSLKGDIHAREKKICSPKRDNTTKGLVRINSSTENGISQNNPVVLKRNTETEENETLSLDQKLSLESEFKVCGKKIYNSNTDRPKSNAGNNVKSSVEIVNSSEKVKS